MNSINKNLLTIILAILILLPNLALADTLDELNKNIDNKKSEIEQIKKEIAIYQKNIRIKQEEVLSLKNQLSIIENRIAKTELDIQATEIEIDKIQLENRETELQIIAKENTIDNQKENLAETIRELQKKESDSPLKIFVLNDTLSEFFNEVEHTKSLQNSLKDTLKEIKSEKKVLTEKKKELQNKEERLLELKNELELQRVELTAETQYKNDLLIDTKNSEAKFQELYQKAKQEQQNISAEIYNLEKAARAKLEQLKDDQPKLTDSRLSWPVPKNKITAGFHDPDYPYRHLFEHPAIDIRAAQGTKITAPAEGYVLKVRDNGMGYSYVALIHADGLSTVYGHVSKIYVKEDEYVTRGEVIALSGGMPGTPGAGNLSSGPHLHFEVRLNGIPVNPIDYLP